VETPSPHSVVVAVVAQTHSITFQRRTVAPADQVEVQVVSVFLPLLLPAPLLVGLLTSTLVDVVLETLSITWHLFMVEAAAVVAPAQLEHLPSHRIQLQLQYLESAAMRFISLEDA
jgi:hypothetical protein